MPQLKALIFDLDNTIAISQYLHYLAFKAVFDKYGIPYSEETDRRYSGKGSKFSFPEIFAEHGVTITPEQVEQYSKEKKVIYMDLLKKADLKAVPGIKAFCEKAKQAGLKMVIASGNRLEAAEIILERTDLRQYFDAIVTNKDIALPKPAPDIFLEAAKRMGATSTEAVVFEDASNGIVAAQAAGMPCVVLTTSHPREKLLELGANKIIDSYDEVDLASLQGLLDANNNK